MRDYLSFHLYGPIASWGKVAVGEYRPSDAHPSKSAIIGMIAAALGIRRDEEERQVELNRGYRMAVRVDASGELMRDYHTVQTPTAERGVSYATRRDELRHSPLKLNTLISTRDYRMDGRYTVLIWQHESDVTYSLQKIADKLNKPEFTLYLGRKSCPLALPLDASVVPAPTLLDAFQKSRCKWEKMPKPDETTLYYWEETDHSGMEASMVYPRRDDFISRQRWQFRERNEYFASRQEKA